MRGEGSCVRERCINKTHTVRGTDTRIRAGLLECPSLLRFVRPSALQLFISLMVPLVVATLNSLPPPPTVPESSLEL